MDWSVRELVRRGSGGPAALLGAGAVNGLAAYAFIILGVRTFGADDFAPVAVVWSLWAIGAAGITSPLQHWAIHTARVTGSERPMAARRQRLVVGAVGIAAVVWLASSPTRDVLFAATSPVYPAVAAAVVITATLAGYVRGVLGGRDRFVALAGSLVGDGLLRLGLLVLVVVTGLGVEAAAVAIPAGTLVVVCWTSTARLEDHRDQTSPAPPLGVLSIAFLLLHTLLNAPPVLASAQQADPEVVSSLFAAFAVFRAPFLLLTTLSTKVSYALASWVGRSASAELERFRRAVAATTVGISVVGWLLGAAPADWVLALVYGPEVRLPEGSGPAIVAGSATSLGVLLLMLLLASRDRTQASLRPLVVALAISAALSILGPGGVGARIALGFLAGQVTAFCLLLQADLRAARNREETGTDAHRPTVRDPRDLGREAP